MGGSLVCSKVVTGSTGLLVNLLAGTFNVSLPPKSPVELDLGAAVKYELRLLCDGKDDHGTVLSLTDNLTGATSAALLSSLSDQARAKSSAPAGTSGKYAVTPGVTWLDVDWALVAWYEKSDAPGVFKLNAFGFRPTALGLSIQKSIP